jgi:hypothetical protein
MYERIDKNLSNETGKFVLPDIDLNQALALLQSWTLTNPRGGMSSEKPGNT